MRQAKNKVRMPAYMRSGYVESQNDAELSVGDVLRKVNRRLIIRQVIWVAFYLLIIGALIYGFLSGNFEKATDYIIDLFIK